jgi:hypothetical protein
VRGGGLAKTLRGGTVALRRILRALHNWHSAPRHRTGETSPVPNALRSRDDGAWRLRSTESSAQQGLILVGRLAGLHGADQVDRGFELKTLDGERS